MGLGIMAPLERQFRMFQVGFGGFEQRLRFLDLLDRRAFFEEFQTGIGGGEGRFRGVEGFGFRFVGHRRDLAASQQIIEGFEFIFQAVHTGLGFLAIIARAFDFVAADSLA